MNTQAICHTAGKQWSWDSSCRGVPLCRICTQHAACLGHQLEYKIPLIRELEGCDFSID